MIDFLLYSTLHCEDADAIMLKIRNNLEMSSIVRIELIETIQEATPECPWDAND